MSESSDMAIQMILVQKARIAYEALSASAQQEMAGFICNSQDTGGGFNDRAGNPDLYYSLFGLWLSLAAGQTGCLEKLRTYIDSEHRFTNPVEELALVLTEVELSPQKRRRSGISLVKTILNRSCTINISYRVFLLTLALDATGQHKGILRLLIRIGLLVYRPGGNIPSSLTSALLYARKIVGMSVNRLQEKLTAFYKEDEGFVAFHAAGGCDMLSTGVALFALAETGYDLRLIRPGCLRFVQENYISGAFLSGDGDPTMDLEYTFYGLLALGSLMKNEE